MARCERKEAQDLFKKSVITTSFRVRPRTSSA